MNLIDFPAEVLEQIVQTSQEPNVFLAHPKFTTRDVQGDLVSWLSSRESIHVWNGTGTDKPYNKEKIVVLHFISTINPSYISIFDGVEYLYITGVKRSFILKGNDIKVLSLFHVPNERTVDVLKCPSLQAIVHCTYCIPYHDEVGKKETRIIGNLNKVPNYVVQSMYRAHSSHQSFSTYSAMKPKLDMIDDFGDILDVRARKLMNYIFGTIVLGQMIFFLMT